MISLPERGHQEDGEQEQEQPLQPLPNGVIKRGNLTVAEDYDQELPPAKRIRSHGNAETSSFFAAQSPPEKHTSTIQKASSRTERYLYSSSQPAQTQSDDGSDDEAVKTRKEELHRKFVKKLGHPDSIAQIKRRKWLITEETEALDEDEGAPEEDESPPPQTKTKRKGAKTGKLTPMELQILDIKRQHMDTLLIVEVGYKFRFYGEDARIAAKELSIVCIPGKFRFDEHPSEAHLDRFASASIPVHRLPVHAKRLVAAGHKIGVVRQIETAALKKVGDNRNTPFIRKLTNVYTKGTYIDDTEGLDHPGEVSGAPATGYLMCITESKAKGWGTDEKVDIGMLAVQPATGDVIYDSFEDGFMRNELETRLHHIAPCEMLVVGELTKATDKLVKHLAGSTTNIFGDRIRVEYVGRTKTMAAESHSHVTRFYADKLKTTDDTSASREQSLLDKVLNLEEPVTICLSAMITHMTEYGLEHVFDLTQYFQSFSTRSHMLLNGNTLVSLEIYQNQSDHTERGSLFWCINKTQTRFGQRLLRKWVGRPLLDKARLEERVAAVEELAEGSNTPKVDKLRSLLPRVKSDLERSLIRIYYGKCSRPELLTVLQTMQLIGNEYASVKMASDAGFKSELINTAIASLPTIADIVIHILDQMSAEAARKDDKYAFFREESETEAIADHKLGIAAVESELAAHRSVAAAMLKKKGPLPYVTVAAIEYLIEIANTDLKLVPASWTKISGTKKVSRFHTPEVVRMLRERDQHKESLSAACDAAYAAFLVSISSHYAVLRDTIANLAVLDCLCSLATVAQLPGYVKPTFSDRTEILIEEGRHPMVEQLLSTTYMPNSISLSNAPADPIHHSQPHPHALLLTGPNMGGKSSFVRQTALICILAQIGSFVPAAAAHLGLLDGIYTRMGAYDSLFTGQSTFMVELSETAAILKSATRRSLVILDELGRGTSTHDGTAIAEGVLVHVVRELACLCLFVTHYQSLSSVEKSFGAGQLKNVHMKFGASKDARGDEEITFLYEVGDGVAHRSYGLNVARLAHIPRSVLDAAAERSSQLELQVTQKKLQNMSRMMSRVLASDADSLQRLVMGVEQL